MEADRSRGIDHKRAGLLMLLAKLIRKLIPADIQAPRRPLNEILARSGYFRFRTRVAAHGVPVPDVHLYRPLFSPWEGEASFEAIFQKVKSHTLCSRDRCYILWTTLRQALVNGGDVVECGVFRGGTALLEALTIQAHASHGGRTLHLFDSFEGMPETTEGVDRLKRGDLGKTSITTVKKLLQSFPFVDLHPGFIPATFVGLNIEKICWAHVDVDVYQSVCDCISFIYPRLVPGGFMIFDDYGFPSCPGARRAVGEGFADSAEVPICLPTGQCLIIKANESKRD
jgi:O-methyltransferase